MHLPDGQLDPLTLAACAVGSAVALGVAFKSLRAGHGRTTMALAGGAALVVAHLADVPLDDSLTGHVIGGAALAVLVGPALALVVVTAVLASEALLWGDGGSYALGANVWVMGVVGVLVGYGVYRGITLAAGRWWGASSDRGTGWLTRNQARYDVSRVAASAVGGFLSVMASAAMVGVLYAAAGGGEQWRQMLGVSGPYIAWGALEGGVTAVVVAVAIAWRRIASPPAHRGVAARVTAGSRRVE